MKRKFLVLLIVLISFVSFSTIKASGLTYYDDTNNTGYTSLETADQNYYAQGISHKTEIGRILTGSSTTDIAVNTIQGKMNPDSKVVTWSVKNNTNSGFVLSQLSTIAKDYEEKHPGWKVMGLINGDQFTLGRGTDLSAKGQDPYIYQTYYPYIADNEKLFSVTANAGSGNFVGITNGNDSLVKTSASLSNIAGLMLSVFNENGEVIKKFTVEKLNEEPGVNGTAIYSPYYTDTQGTIPDIEVTGENIFYVSNADLAYVSNTKVYKDIFTGTKKADSASDAFFGKGVISEITSKATVSKGQFAIKTNNTEILESLEVGTRVLAQFEYKDEANNFESGIGFHAVQRDEGIDKAVSGTYNTNIRTRSVIGRKSDGTIVLMVVDDYQDSYGVTGYGINAILKSLGVVEAYQMDGGGSAQMFIRKGSTFEPVTQSADYPQGSKTQRSVLNAVLFVVREIDIEHSLVANGINTLDIGVNILNTYGKDVNKVYVKIGAKKMEVIEGVAKFTSMKPNTTFNYSILIEDSLGNVQETVFGGEANTSKREPKITGFTYAVIDDKYQITPIITDNDDAITTMSMKIKGSWYSISNGTFTVNRVDGLPIIYYYYDLKDGNKTQSGEYMLLDYITTIQFIDGLIYIQEEEIINLYQ